MAPLSLSAPTWAQKIEHAEMIIQAHLEETRAREGSEYDEDTWEDEQDESELCNSFVAHDPVQRTDRTTTWKNYQAFVAGPNVPPRTLLEDTEEDRAERYETRKLIRANQDRMNPLTGTPEAKLKALADAGYPLAIREMTWRARRKALLDALGGNPIIIESGTGSDHTVRANFGRS